MNPFNALMAIFGTVANAFSGVFVAMLKIMKGAKGTFVYAILTKWYALIAIPSMYITYEVLYALKKNGILDLSYNCIKDGISIVSQAAVKCTPLLLDLTEFFNCLNN